MSLAKFVKHLFIPHESNNQKAKLLHSSSLLLISIFLLVYQVGLYYINRSKVAILGYAANISIEEVVRLTNEKRASAGLSALEYNQVLSDAAKNKGNDMIARDYWAHVAPDGTEPWKFFKDLGYKYRYAGENLARDFSSASSAVDAWMASPSHKENMLSSKYKEIGVAVVEGDLAGSDTTIVVQLFGTNYADTTPAVPVARESETQARLAVAETIPSPTLVPTPIAITQGVPSVLEQTKANLEDQPQKPLVLISPFSTTKGVSLAVVGLLILVLVLDAFITSKRRIARVAGRTFAHLSFMGMVIAIVMILKAGQIL